MRIRAYITLIAAAMALTALAVPAAASATIAGGCDLVAAPNGTDDAAGTPSEPLRTAAGVVDALDPNQTGCFRSGNYGFDQLSLRASGVTLTSYPNERATLTGMLRIERSATGATVENLVLDGRNPGADFSPLVYADHAILRGNEITNHHTSNCVHVDSYYDTPAPEGVVIEGNRIHDCGRLPATNHDHGIYLADADGTIIRDNLIYRNADRGIQLYPDAQRTRVEGNVIDGNGQGIIFSGDDGVASNGSVVEHNIITNSNVRHNVESFYPEGNPIGKDNVVRENCIYGADGWYGDEGSGIAYPQEGFDAENNIIADPLYVGRAAGDFRLRPGSPCEGVLRKQPAGPRLELDSSSKAVRHGKSVTLRGTAPGHALPQVWILKRVHGNWRSVGQAKVRGSSFKARAKVTAKKLLFKARAPGMRDSRTVRVALR